MATSFAPWVWLREVRREEERFIECNLALLWPRFIMPIFLNWEEKPQDVDKQQEQVVTIILPIYQLKSVSLPHLSVPTQGKTLVSWTAVGVESPLSSRPTLFRRWVPILSHIGKGINVIMLPQMTSNLQHLQVLLDSKEMDEPIIRQSEKRGLWEWVRVEILGLEFLGHGVPGDTYMEFYSVASKLLLALVEHSTKDKKNVKRFISGWVGGVWKGSSSQPVLALCRVSVL